RKGDDSQRPPRARPAADRRPVRLLHVPPVQPRGAPPPGARARDAGRAARHAPQPALLPPSHAGAARGARRGRVSRRGRDRGGGLGVAVATAWAQTGDAAGPPPLVVQFAPIVLIAAIVYFLLIRPEQQRRREIKGQVDALKRNDQVVLSCG